MARLNLLLGVVVVLNYAVGTLLVWDGFRSYPDHSAASVVRWAAIYLMAVVQPIVWGFYHLRILRSKGLQTDRQLRAMAFSPMVVGGVTLLIALNLIARR